VETRTQSQSGTDSRIAAATRAASQLADPAPPAARDRPPPPGVPAPKPDDLVVHEQDIQGVVNALWAGGAEGMSIMDERVVATTAVRCVGNTLLLHGAVYSPPFVIRAIGDPTRLAAALDDASSVQLFRQYVDAYGLVLDAVPDRGLRLPAYDGAVEVEAQPIP
jgi:uncharacterized protein YlxW (UPF0749 family)